MAGTQLEIKIDELFPAFPLCKRCFEWTLAWVNWSMLLPGWFSCWADRLRVVCNKDGTNCRSPEGVHVRTRRGLDSILYIDSSKRVGVYDTLAGVLEALGWRPDLDLIAHPYDFRYAAAEAAQPGRSFEDLKAQIEEVVHRTGRPAIIIALSLGQQYFGVFLGSYVDAAWKQRYVHAFISLAGFWGGAASGQRAVISAQWGGVQLLLDKGRFLSFMRSLPVASWVLPAPSMFADDTLVANSATGRRYRAADFGQLMEDVGADQVAAVWRNTKDSIELPAPNVTTYCIYGYGVPTDHILTYSKRDFSDEPQVGRVDGDGTVVLRSLEACRHWSREQQVAPVTVRAFYGMMHTLVLHDRRGFSAVMDAIKELHSAAA